VRFFRKDFLMKYRSVGCLALLGLAMFGVISGYSPKVHAGQGNDFTWIDCSTPCTWRQTGVCVTCHRGETWHMVVGEGTGYEEPWPFTESCGYHGTGTCKYDSATTSYYCQTIDDHYDDPCTRPWARPQPNPGDTGGGGVGEG
jgi:hypothetical protein